MHYIFTTRHSRVEIRSWNGRIVETPETYRFLLGKPVEAAITWFKTIEGVVMTVGQDTTPPRRTRVIQPEED